EISEMPQRWRRWPGASLAPDKIWLETQDLRSQTLTLAEFPAWRVTRGRGQGTAYSFAPYAAAWRTLGETLREPLVREDNAVAALDLGRLTTFHRRFGPLHSATGASDV